MPRRTPPPIRIVVHTAEDELAARIARLDALDLMIDWILEDRAAAAPAEVDKQAS